MPQNIPSIDAIAADGALAVELDLETIAILIEDAKAMSARATSVSRLLQGEVEARLKDQIAATFLADGKDTGTVHVISDGCNVEVTRSKKVEWSQADLAVLRTQILAANDNPDQYIDVKYAVQERKFTAWPDTIQSKFAAARTVVPGTTSIKIKRAA